MNDRKYGLNSIKTFLYYWYNINYNKYMSLLTEYDVIYIDIFDSKLNIQANAKMFERAIEIINQRKRIDGCTEKNIPDFITFFNFSYKPALQVSVAAFFSLIWVTHGNFVSSCYVCA